VDWLQGVRSKVDFFMLGRSKKVNHLSSIGCGYGGGDVSFFPHLPGLELYKKPPYDFATEGDILYRTDIFHLEL
jgi:hypothetical protein